MITDEQIIAAAGEPVHWRAILSEGQQYGEICDTPRVVGFSVLKAAEQFCAEKKDFKGWIYTIEQLYTSDAILSAAKPLRDRIAELEANESTMKAYCEQVFEDGGKRIAESLAREAKLQAALQRLNEQSSNKSFWKGSTESNAGARRVVKQLWPLIREALAIPSDASALNELIAERTAELTKQRDRLLDALSGVAENLRRVGADIPAPQKNDAIEGAHLSGLSIALLLVEDAISSVKDAA